MNDDTPTALNASESGTTHDAATCHACKGDGFFWVPDESDDIAGCYSQDPCMYCEGTGRELPHQTETRRLTDSTTAQAVLPNSGHPTP